MNGVQIVCDSYAEFTALHTTVVAVVLFNKSVCFSQSDRNNLRSIRLPIKNAHQMVSVLGQVSFLKISKYSEYA